MSCLLSIVIPTKDRYKYLFQLIPLIDSYKLKRVELVIEDNSSVNLEYVKFMDAHVFSIPIVYNNCKKQLPVRYNIDNAILHSRGKYVCVIGDDDAVTPLIIDCVTWMEKNNIESVRQKHEITYKWPAYKDERYNISAGGYLKFFSFTSVHDCIVPKDAAIDVIKGGFRGLGNCPCVYQGIVRRDILFELYKIGETFTPGPSPDMANAMALSYVVKKHYVIDAPVIISGGSEFQGGKNAKIKSWVQPLSNILFISEQDKSNWDSRIPYFWSETTVWPESGIKGLEYVGKGDNLDYCDFDMILARSLFRAPDYRKHILSKSPSKRKVLLLYYMLQIREILAKFKRFLLKRRIIKQMNLEQITNVTNIASAVNLLQNVKWIN